MVENTFTKRKNTQDSRICYKGESNKTKTYPQATIWNCTNIVTLTFKKHDNYNIWSS